MLQTSTIPFVYTTRALSRLTVSSKDTQNFVDNFLKTIKMETICVLFSYNSETNNDLKRTHGIFTQFTEVCDRKTSRKCF